MSKIARETFIKKAKETYNNNEECMYDLLGFIKPSKDMTLEDCFLAYCELMNWSDSDAFLRVNQDDDFCKDITADREYKCSEIFLQNTRTLLF